MAVWKSENLAFSHLISLVYLTFCVVAQVILDPEILLYLRSYNISTTYPVVFSWPCHIWLASDGPCSHCPGYNSGYNTAHPSRISSGYARCGCSCYALPIRSDVCGPRRRSPDTRVCSDCLAIHWMVPPSDPMQKDITHCEDYSTVLLVET